MPNKYKSISYGGSVYTINLWEHSLERTVSSRPATLAESALENFDELVQKCFCETELMPVLVNLSSGRCCMVHDQKNTINLVIKRMKGNRIAVVTTLPFSYKTLFHKPTDVCLRVLRNGKVKLCDPDIPPFFTKPSAAKR